MQYVINKNWNRWIFASLSKHFKDGIVPAHTFVVEGQNFDEQGELIQLRTSGPEWVRSSRRKFRGDVIVNILVQAIEHEKDFHKIYKMVGLVESTFALCIPIKKYGNSADDDPNVIIGQLILTSKVDTEHFGRIVPEIPAIKSTVEAIYRADLTD